MDIKKIINDLFADAYKGTQELTGKDKVMAEIGLANMLCNFLSVPGVSTGTFDEYQEKVAGSKKKRATKKPAPPATAEETAEPPKAKEVAQPAPEEPVQEESPAENEAPAETQAAAAPADVTGEEPVFEVWDEDAQAYYADGLDELYDIVSVLDGDPETNINALMQDFSSDTVKTFEDSSPMAFPAFLTYVKECAAAGSNEAVG